MLVQIQTTMQLDVPYKPAIDLSPALVGHVQPPIFQVATPMCGCIWLLQFIDLHGTLEFVSILVWVARAVALDVRMWITGRRQALESAVRR
jgi:hypothetical protein